MQTVLDASSQHEANIDYSDQQLFVQWAKERSVLYQAMEQQVQTSIAQVLQLASEFTIKMEEETNQLLSRYRQQRLDAQAQLDALHQEMNDQRAVLEQERQANAEELAAERQREEARIAQQRWQAQSAIEKQQAAAKAEREQLLREAYQERDNVLAETRQLSSRLAELQQALQSMLGVALPLQSQTQLVPEPAPPRAASKPAPEPVAKELAPQAQVAPAESISAAPTPSNGTQQEPLAPALSQLSGTGLVIEGVKSFVLASELMDRFEQNRAVEEMNLLQYEQGTLQLSIRCAEDTSLETLLREQFGETLEIVEVNQNTIQLRMHDTAASE